MRAGWLVPVLALTLTACSGSPRDELRGDVEAVTLAANSGSAAALRDAVAELRATLRAQVASRDLERAEAERLNAIALRLLENADLLNAPEASPEPEPSPPAEEPSPEPEPEPTMEPEPEPTQEEEPEPEPTEEEPEPEETLEVIVPPVEESPPAPQSQGGGGTSSEPSPAA